MSIQKVVTVYEVDGEYTNFFYTPGSSGSLDGHIKSGWFVKFIKDEGDHAVILFEKNNEEKQEAK